MAEQTGKGWLLQLRIAGATFAVCSAPVGFCVFAILFHNYFAGVANAIVGVIGGFNLHLHLSFKKDAFTQNYSSKWLTVLKWASVIVGFFGLVAAFTFFCLAGIHKIPILPIGNSMILPGIQSLLVVQECATHFFCRRKYLKLTGESDRTHIVDESEGSANGSATVSVVEVA